MRSSWWCLWRPWLASLPFLILSILGVLHPQTRTSKGDRGLELVRSQGLGDVGVGGGELVESSPLLVDKNDSSESSGLPLPVGGAGKRTLLSASLAKSEIAVLAFLDGTVYFLDGNSGKVIGNFSLGSPLSSSYQVHTDDGDADDDGNDDDYFIYCGDDFKLYEHSRDFGEKELGMSAEEYVGQTPIKHADGSATMGASKLTTLLFDAKTGKVINPVWPDFPASGKMRKEDKAIVPKIPDGRYFESSHAEVGTFKIVKREYAITHYTKSRRLSWYMTVSYIEVYQCLGLDAFDCSFSKKLAVYPFLDNDPFSLGVGLPKALQLPEPTIEWNFVQENATKAEPTQPRYGRSSLPALPSGGHHFTELTMERAASNSTVPNGSVVISNASHSMGGFTIKSITSFPWLIIPPIFIILLVYMLYSYIMSHKLSTASVKKESAVTKKKRARKPGNNKNGTVVDKNNSPNSRNQEADISTLNSEEKKDRDIFFSHLKISEHIDGKWVGKLFVSSSEIAKGSNGTIVLEGIHDGRPVAVKRLVRAHHDVASKEIQILIASDRHPNIVRWFGVEYDPDFVYLSLERCSCSLYDLVQVHSDSPDMLADAPSSNSFSNFKLKFSSSENAEMGVELWKENGFPSYQMIKLIRDIVSGLAHLHELGIIHRDLKPQNVLINFDKIPSAKISDMGISKHLPQDMSSIGHHTTGHGSSGWQAPEQLLRGRQTRAVDLFSLGCVLFFCLTKGKHPFGSYYERDTNILNNRLDLFLVEHIPEAVHLFTRLLVPNPDLRPKADEVLYHPLFWDSETRLSFLRDTSDRVELEDRESTSDLLNALERIGSMAFGGKWGDKLDAPFVMDMGRYRKYKFESTRDLLRVIRNKLNHFRELPKDLQEILAPVPEGFDDYFTRRFPRLLIEVYHVVYEYCREDDIFRKYFKSR